MVVIIESRKWNIDIVVEIIRSLCVLYHKEITNMLCQFKLSPCLTIMNALVSFNQFDQPNHQLFCLSLTVCTSLTYEVYGQVLALCIETIVNDGHNSAFPGNILLPDSCHIDIVAGLTRIVLKQDNNNKQTSQLASE